MKKLLLVTILFLMGMVSYSQNTRITDPNTIGWYAFTANIKLNDKWSFNSEFQWRRDVLITEPMQNLLRTDINYSVNPSLGIRAGYALAETYNYGDFPLNNLGNSSLNTEPGKW